MTSDPHGAPTATLLGSAPSIVSLRRDLLRVANSRASSVLVLGESGTGKELVARALHDESPRAARAFVAVNCSAVPTTLLEEEFFGHEPGAFTDARGRKPGLLEVADGGTLFLDEVSELDPSLQAKCLRFLEERRFRRLGGVEEVAVDVRFVAATNVDLAARVAEGTFRQDLYYRVQVVTLRIPPLRERREDVPLLATHLLERLGRELDRGCSGFTPEALDALRAHDWPGNVRELRNAIERALLLGDGPRITPAALDLPAPGAQDVAPAAAAPIDDDLDLGHLELRALTRALERAHGNLSQAARLLGVSRDTVRARMRARRVRLETRVVVDDGGDA